MKRTLILSAGYGEGHNAAAKALAAAFADAGEEAQVRDLFLEAYGRKQETSRNLYLHCIENTPWLWALTYHTLDRVPVMRHVIAPLLNRMQEMLARVLAEWKPNAVVSVYPGYNYLLDRLYPNGGAPFARHTLVTDSITINSIWHRAGSDSWMVPNEDTADVMRLAGVPSDRVHVTGFPVPLVFADQRPDRALPGNGEPLRVFFMVNSNRKPAPEIVRRLLGMPGIALTVAAGKDPLLARQLEAIAAEMNRPLELHGWTNRMPELLMRNHVLIGKAGGAATQETLAAETPILVTKVVPGQELGNAQLIEKHGCGAVVESPAAVQDQIEALLKDDCALWHRWHSAAQKLSHPDAARSSARFILNFGATPVQEMAR